MSAIQITAATKEAALKEVQERYGLPAEALEMQWTQETEDLVAGARPYVQLNAEIKLEYVGHKVQECLVRLLEHMEIEARVAAVMDRNMVLVKVDTEDQDILIGHRGETLDAIQQLVLRMARLSGREIPLVLIDVAHYRERRIQRLRRVALDLARTVVQTGKEEYFDPMDSIDRRIVHTILKDFRGVKTYSKGEDLSRHVIVAPAD